MLGQRRYYHLSTSTLPIIITAHLLTRENMTFMHTSMHVNRLATSSSVTTNTATNARPMFIYNSFCITRLVSQFLNIIDHTNDCPGKYCEERSSKYSSAANSSSELEKPLTVNPTFDAYNKEYLAIAKRHFQYLCF